MHPPKNRLLTKETVTFKSFSYNNGTKRDKIKEKGEWKERSTSAPNTPLHLTTYVKMTHNREHLK